LSRYIPLKILGTDPVGKTRQESHPNICLVKGKAELMDEGILPAGMEASRAEAHAPTVFSEFKEHCLVIYF